MLNTIKLRILPATSVTGQPTPPWDLSCEPAVTNSQHGPRGTSYEHLGDDEHSMSDSAHSSSSNIAPVGIQGSFPSTNRLRVRWAAPMNRNQGHGMFADGRRKVGVDDVTGQLHCVVLGQDDQKRTKLRLNYEGTCRGLSFPGVATQLGLEVRLDPKGRLVTWASEDDQWEVTGGVGVTGHHCGPMVNSPHTPTRGQHSNHSRPPSSSSQAPTTYHSASLLRTQLPNQSISPDFSFEGTPSPTLSMINSVGSNYPESSNGVPDTFPPTHPIILHVNIGDLPPPPKNELNFQIQGTIIVGPARDPEDDNVLVLPVFKVSPTESEKTNLVVSSEAGDVLEVIFPQPQGSRQPPRRRILRRRSEIRAEDGVSVAFESKTAAPSPSIAPSTPTLRVSPSTPSKTSPLMNGVQRRLSHKLPPASASPLVPLPSGPRSIPWVNAKITVLPTSQIHSHAVHFSVPIVAVLDGTLAFGVCLPSFLIGEKGANIDVLWATADGRNLPVDVFPKHPEIEDSRQFSELFNKDLRVEDFSPTLGQESQGLALRDMVSWIQVSVPDEGLFGDIEVNYLIGKEPQTSDAQVYGTARRRKNKEGVEASISALLPCFHVGVGNYTVQVSTPQGYEPPVVKSNFYQDGTGSLTHYRVPGYFWPQVALELRKVTVPPTWTTLSVLRNLCSLGAAFIAPVLSLLVLWMVFNIQRDMHDMQLIINSPSLGSNPSPSLAESTRILPHESIAEDPSYTTRTYATTFPYTGNHATHDSTPTPTAHANNQVSANVFSLLPAIPFAFISNLDWKYFAQEFATRCGWILKFLNNVFNYPVPA